MHTQDDLRAGMNALATATEPLSATAVLHDARRYRTRRRLMAATGAAAAIVAVTAGVIVAGPSLLDRNTPGPGPVAGVSTAATSPAPTREQRFVFGKEYPSDRGAHTTLVTDTLFPGLEPETEIRVDRAPGQNTQPTGEDESTGDTVRHLTVDGVRVRVDEYDVADGKRSQLTWTWRDTGYVLTASRGLTDDAVPYGASDDDLIWLVQQVMNRHPK